MSNVEPLVISALSPTNNSLLQAWQGVGKGAYVPCPITVELRLKVYQCITNDRHLFTAKTHWLYCLYFELFLFPQPMCIACVWKKKLFLFPTFLNPLDVDT